MSKIFFGLISIFVFCGLVQPDAFAQETKDDSKKPVEWVRVENNSGEFSIELPSDFTYFYDADGFNYNNMNQSYGFKQMQMLNGSMEKTVMCVEMYKVPAPKKYLGELVERMRLNGTKTEESLDGFTVKQFEQTRIFDSVNKKEVEISFITRLIASKSSLYVVTVINRGAKSPAATRFLSSILLNKTASSDKVINLSNLKPFTIDQIGEMDEDETPKRTQPVQPVKPTEKNETPLLVLLKPHAAYTEAARQALISGTIRLRITFGVSGRISKITVVSSLEKGLTRNAVMAALRIKFIPLEKENKVEETRKTIEYSFSIR